jgi:hypothetical protein
VQKKYKNAGEDEIIYRSALLLFNKKKYKNALKRFLEVLYKYNRSHFREDALINTVLSYINLRQYILAEEEIKLYLKKYSSLKRRDIIFYNRAYVAEKLNYTKKALKYYELAIKTSKTKSLKYLASINKIKLFISLSQRYEAKKLLNELKSKLSSLCLVNKNQISYLEKTIKWQYLLKYKIRNSSISHIALNKNLVYILTWTNGIIVFDRLKNRIVKRYKKENGLISNLVRHIAFEQSKIWVTTYAGLSYLDTQHNLWHKLTQAGAPKNLLKSIAVNERFVWVGTLGKGLFILDKKKGTWKNLTKENGLPGNAVVSIKLYRKKLWLATLDGGIGYININDNSATTLNPSAGNTPKNIKSVDVNENAIACATFKNGLYVYNLKKHLWFHFSKENNSLPSNNLLSVKIIEGKVYSGTFSHGVVILDIATNKIKRLTAKDGLLPDDVTSIEKEGHYIWFGTIKSGISILTN